MHPIERLRFVAGAKGAPGEVLAAEAARALGAFADDPAGLTAACRRVLARQVTCGPLWWVCARLLTAESVREAATESIRLIEADTTGAEVSLALANREPGSPQPLVVQALAFGSDGAFVAAVDAESIEAVADSSGAGVAELWLVGGVGVHLAEPLWKAVIAHHDDYGSSRVELVALGDFAEVFGPEGRLPADRLGPPDCPVAPELFRLAG